MSNPIKLLHLVYSLHVGGMENGVVNLCNRLDPEKFSAAICVLEGGGALEEHVDSTRVKIYRVKRHFGNDPSVPMRLMWFLRRGRYDILHTHNWVTLFEGFLAAKAACVPAIIHSEHGYPFETRPRNVRIQRIIWPRVAQVATVARSLADDLSNVVRYPKDRMHVIPNGVDTEKFRPNQANHDELRKMFKLPRKGILIGKVARLDPVKNHAGIIRALGKLRRRGFDAHLVLAGEGPEQAALLRLASELELSDYIFLLGNVTKVEMLLNALDIFVLNSDAEGMSNTVLEAMASGLPVVVTRVGNNSDLLVDGESGFLVPPGADTALADVIESLATQPHLRLRAGNAARQRVKQHFSLDRMITRYSDLYHEVCN